MYFLEFCRGYFIHREVFNPFVVEIGVKEGKQRPFYEQYLNAQYIGIDINTNTPATIKGDSKNPETWSKLMEILNGDQIDLLFIDGAHDYATVESDYEMYSPIVRHIIAFHDLCGMREDVGKFWRFIVEKEKLRYTFITIFQWGYYPVHSGDVMGIGMMIKKYD